MDELLTVAEVADVLHVSTKTVMRRIADGELTATREHNGRGRHGWRYLVEWRAVVAMVEEYG